MGGFDSFQAETAYWACIHAATAIEATARADYVQAAWHIKQVARLTWCATEGMWVSRFSRRLDYAEQCARAEGHDPEQPKGYLVPGEIVAEIDEPSAGENARRSAEIRQWLREGKCPTCGELGGYQAGGFVCSVHGPYPTVAKVPTEEDVAAQPDDGPEAHLAEEEEGESCAGGWGHPVQDPAECRRCGVEVREVVGPSPLYEKLEAAIQKKKDAMRLLTLGDVRNHRDLVPSFDEEYEARRRQLRNALAVAAVGGC